MHLFLFYLPLSVDVASKVSVYTKRFVHTREEGSGPSWRFAKEPRRFLCRFFAPLSSRRRKGNPLLSPGRRESVSADDTAGYQKAVGLLKLKCIEHAVVAQAATGSYFLPRRKYAKTGKGLHPLDPRGLHRDTPE